MIKMVSSVKKGLVTLVFIVIIVQFVSYKYENSKMQYFAAVSTCAPPVVHFIEPSDISNKLKNNVNSSVVQRVEKLTGCKDTIQKPSLQQKGEYWVLYNYAISKYQFKCAESISYTTHGDFSFLDNIEPLATRWNGPISIALFAPGDDFQQTIDSIKYLRQCGPSIITNLVTFHLFFSNQHMPSNIPRNDYINQPHDCEVTAPFLNINSTRMFKSVNNLTYPVNVARNIARIAAQTHFVLASDIELYPSDNIIPRFLNMIARNEDPLNKQVNKIFPLPLFEIEDDQKVPGTKTSLLALLKANKAIPFHKRVCAACHKIPKDEEWKEAVEGDQINVFVVGKRTGIFHHWEPIYIGTNAEPLYEERQSWEGKSDKMTQGYALCVLDYDFMILDNAFLVHRPGIKTYKADYDRDILAAKTSSLIKNKIHPELKILYGEKQGCSM